MKRNLLVIILLLLTKIWSIGQEAPEWAVANETGEAIVAKSLSDFKVKQSIKGSSLEEVFYEGFEGEEFPPAGWKIIEGGSPDRTWERYVGDSVRNPIAGNASACIRYSYKQSHDDWLITPPLVPIPGRSALSFRARQGSSRYQEYFNVKLSTTGNNKEDFTVTLAEEVIPAGEVPEYFTYDLSAYEGQTVYVAIHMTSFNKFMLIVDDFAMTPTNLVVKGGNKGYTQIPRCLLDSVLVLWADVTNAGQGLLEEVDVTHAIKDASDEVVFSSTTVLPDLGAGERQMILASAYFDATTLSVGDYTYTYTADYAADHDSSDNTDVFNFSVTDYIYARDNGEFEKIGGLNAHFANLFTIPKPVTISGVEFVWADSAFAVHTDAAPYQLALYKVRTDLSVEQTIFTTKTYEAYQSHAGQTVNIAVRPVVLDPGSYVLLIRQTSPYIISIAHDRAEHGYFIYADDSENPTQFTKWGLGWGFVSLRMDFTPRSVVSFNVADGTNPVGGIPIEGATITAMQGETVIETVVTDSLGKAEIYVVNGNYTYSVTAPGYEPKSDVLFAVSGDTTINVELDQSLPALVVTPDTFTFEGTYITLSSAPQAFTMQNTGGGTVTVNPSDITITGANADQFTLTTIANTVSLGMGDTASFTVKFTPTTVGEQTAIIKVNDDLGIIHEIIIGGTAIDPVFYEGFEGEEFPPAGWKIIEGGSPDRTWERYVGDSVRNPIAGNASACIRYSYKQSHDDWLITPPLVPIPGRSALSFRARQGSSRYQEYFNVKLSTTGNNKEDFTVTLAEEVIPAGEVPEYFTYDLSAYEGQTVYVAIHMTSFNKFMLIVDDFAMTPTNLVVKGGNKGYTQIPRCLLDSVLVLWADVTNAGQGLLEEVDVTHAIKDASDEVVFSSTTVLPDLGAGERQMILASAYFDATTLSVGDYTYTYTADYAADHDSSDNTDVFNFSVTDYIYARDNGEFEKIGGLNAHFANLFTIPKPVTISGVEFVWADSAFAVHTDAAPYQLALYKVRTDLSVEQTIFTTKTYEAYQSHAGQTVNIAVRPVVLDPGSYVLLIRQTSPYIISIAHDRAEHGYFIYADDSENPTQFTKWGLGWGFVSLRMDFTPRSVVSFNVADGTNPVGGIPIEGATITAMQGETVIETVVTDSLGKAEIYVINGNYTYTFSKSGYPEFTGSFAVNNADQTIDINITTGIEELAASSVRLYPNPVENKLVIERDNGDETVIELYNVSGALIGVTKTENVTTTIDVEALSPGSYFIKVTGTNNTPVVRRFIKK